MNHNLRLFLFRSSQTSVVYCIPEPPIYDRPGASNLVEAPQRCVMRQTHDDKIGLHHPRFFDNRLGISCIRHFGNACRLVVDEECSRAFRQQARREGPEQGLSPAAMTVTAASPASVSSRATSKLRMGLVLIVGSRVYSSLTSQFAQIS